MESKLNLAGISSRLAQDVTDSFRLLDRHGEALVVVEEQELNWLISELASSNINVFNANIELLNIIKVPDTYYIQLKTRPVLRVQYNRTGGVPDVADYFLSQIGFMHTGIDFGTIKIEPCEKEDNFFVQLISHIFSSDDLMIHGHQRFNSRYRVHASDKAAAYHVLSDNVLDTISGFKDLHLSFAKGNIVAYASGLDTDSTVSIMKVMEAFGSRI